jgi:hypothetical protein
MLVFLDTLAKHHLWKTWASEVIHYTLSPVTAPQDHNLSDESSYATCFQAIRRQTILEVESSPAD